MAQATRRLGVRGPGVRGLYPREKAVPGKHSPLTLNADGRPHAVQNRFVALTITLGLVAFLSSFWAGLHLLSSWCGLAGIATGIWGHMISATRPARFVLIIGLGAAAVGFFIGMAHGGLFGGVLG